MELRLLEKGDNLFEISNVYEETWKRAYREIIPQPYLDQIPRGRWVDWLNGNNHQSLILFDEDRIVGTSAYGKERLGQQDCGEIISLYLLPEYWGKGFGKQLMKAAIQNLNRLGYEKICLWVLEENIRARRFYERSGFENTSKFLDDCIGGRALRDVQYVWQRGWI